MSTINTSWIITAIKNALKIHSAIQTSSPKLPAGEVFRYYLSTHPGKNEFQTEDKYRLFKKEFDQIKKEFQQILSSRLNPQAQIEHQLFMDIKDKADIWVDMGEYEVIIEIDAARADQVGKKMLSRYSYSYRLNSIRKNVVYVSLLYLGTDKMNPNECMKYFQMGHEILTKINSKNVFIGYIIDKPRDRVFNANDVKPYQALDSQLYQLYLQTKGITSKNYMKPLNRVHSLSLDPQEVQKKLIQYNYQKKPIAIETFLRKNNIIDKTTQLSPNDGSYWQKYCEYLDWQEKNGTKNKITLNDDLWVVLPADWDYDNESYSEKDWKEAFLWLHFHWDNRIGKEIVDAFEKNAVKFTSPHDLSDHIFKYVFKVIEEPCDLFVEGVEEYSEQIVEFMLDKYKNDKETINKLAKMCVDAVKKRNQITI